ncbi:hypothetical protein B4107_2448 [Bacillus safensis]|nr:hypothetical protein B4107_2448 [Bacillus safensis]
MDQRITFDSFKINASGEPLKGSPVDQEGSELIAAVFHSH